MARLLGGEDVGTAKWGVALTADEEMQLDLVARMTFAEELSRHLLPFARSLPTFAGAWIDQADNGKLVVQITDLDPPTLDRLRGLLPERSRGLTFEYVLYTEAELRLAAERAWDAFPPEPRPVSVGVDTIHNRVRVQFEASDLEAARANADRAEAELGVPVAVEPGHAGQDVICSDRDHCYTPMRGGIMIRKGAIGSVQTCTMGFHIRIGSDEQFLTAGHCGYSGSNNWYHDGYGLVGAELATLYANGGKDVMRVQLDSDAQASALIYADGAFMGSASLPVIGDTVCASMAASNAIDCGTVSDDWTSWRSETAGYTVWGGAMANIYPIPGDSGAPLYRKVLLGGDYYFIPIGIVDHEVDETGNAYFARVTDALAAWGAVLVQ